MSRRLFIAGNWKMNTTATEAVELAGAVATRVADQTAQIDVVVCPPSIYLQSVKDALGASTVLLGAQNCYCESRGAFTGEVSPAMLADVGCTYCILGHSERRQLLAESDELINRKMLAVLGTNLKPILCVGELLEQREAGETESVVEAQLRGCLAGLTPAQMVEVTLAYEPVWAIGTGRTATPQQAQEVHAVIRRWLAERFDETTSSAVRIQYGGSVKPANAAELLAQPDIDGALVGGASLKADDFAAIVQAGSA